MGDGDRARDEVVQRGGLAEVRHPRCLFGLDDRRGLPWRAHRGGRPRSALVLLDDRLAAATASETDPRVRSLVFRAQWVTVVSWLTYPVVYIFPMLGFKGAQAVVNIQVGYCVS